MYNKRLCALVTIIIFFICTFNIVIDPFGVWKLWNHKSVNMFKPQQEIHERLYKAVEITHLKPTVIFIGTSRTHYGLDPSYYLQTCKVKGSIYNAAVSNANMNEMLWYFKHTLKNQPNLKQVIVGIDLSSFNRNLHNRPDFPSGQMEKNHMTFQSFLEISASFDALEASILTVKNNLVTPTFNTYEANNGKPSEFYFQSSYGKIFDLKGFNSINKININNKESYAMYELSQERFNDFRELVNICREKNIDLKVFISPSHATEMEAVRTSGNWQNFENMKRILCAITPIWDFSGYNSITTETISSNRQYYWDSSHYQKKVGNMIIDKINGMMDAAPLDFGVIIQPDNIENQLSYIRQSREIWAKNNPDLIEYVQSLKD